MWNLKDVGLKIISKYPFSMDKPLSVSNNLSDKGDQIRSSKISILMKLYHLSYFWDAIKYFVIGEEFSSYWNWLYYNGCIFETSFKGTKCLWTCMSVKAEQNTGLDWGQMRVTNWGNCTALEKENFFGFPQLLKNHWNSDLFQDHEKKIIKFHGKISKVFKMK